MGAAESDVAATEVAEPDTAERDAAEPDAGVAPAPPPPPEEPSPEESPAKRAATALALVALVASAVLGGNVFGLRERVFGSATEARPAAVSRTADGAVPAPATRAEPLETALRSQPWWQGLAVLEGTGPTNVTPFTVDAGAIQWRVRWTCESGRLVVTGGAEPGPLVDASCPGGGESYGTGSGPVDLQVDADGPWQLEVEQQLDVPLVEAPTPAMTDPSTVVASTGSFYRMDQSATGTVTIYRLADGSHALRLDDFFVTPNVDLEIHLSPLEAPQTTEDFMGAPSAWVAPLDVTAGSMNFVVPPDVDPAQYASVVIWCPLIDSAYAAATLVPAP